MMKRAGSERWWDDPMMERMQHAVKTVKRVSLEASYVSSRDDWLTSSFPTNMKNSEILENFEDNNKKKN